MKTKQRKTFSFAVALMALTLFMAGCSSPSSTPAEPRESMAETSGAQGDEPPVGSSETGTGEQAKLTLFVDETWWPYESWTGAIPEEFSKLANVQLEATKAVDNNQLPLMVASGDMPDIVCSPRPERMADSKVSYPLDELHTQYPNIDFPVHSVLQFLNQAADGHYYTIGCDFSPNSVFKENPGILTEGPGLLFRQDMLEELGNPAITSFAELESLFAQVKGQYPDVYPATFNSVHKFNWVKMMMGVPIESFFNDDNQLKWNLRHEDQLEFYKTVNRWYREGYLVSENFAFKTEDETKEIIFSGKTFAYFGYTNNADNYNPTLLQNNAGFQLTQFSGVISDEATRYNNSAGGRGLYITRSCTDVEAAYRVLATAYGAEGMKLLSWGIEGNDYTISDQGYPQFNYDKESDADLKPRGLKYWGWLVGDNYVNGVTNYGTENQMLAPMQSMSEITERNPVVGMIRFAPDSEEAVIQSKINSMVDIESVKVYMAASEEECEAAFNAMVATAEEMGMSQLEQYVNARYPELKTQYDAIADNNE